MARLERFEWRIAGWSAVLAASGESFGLWLIWHLHAAVAVKITASASLTLMLILSARALLSAATRPLQGLANVVEAYRGGDYTLRGSRGTAGDALGDLIIEINALGGTLHEQRLKSMEASALLDELIATIDVAVLAFNSERRLSLLNPAAVRLLGLSGKPAGSPTASELGLSELLNEAAHSQIVTSIAGRVGRWQVIHGTFRESGLAQHLLIVSDVKHALREEERAAWQRLVRVIGHEVNNSLAPIKSMAESLQSLLAGLLAPGQTRDDTLNALRIIADRTASLGKFLAQYSRLARLPGAKPRWQLLGPILSRVAALESLHPIEISAPADLEAYIDADPFEQALINLAKNAVEAAEGAGRVRIEARALGMDLVIRVLDDGPGIANPDNLFVPFFTTKPGGSGVGLVLSRQIAEAHGGALTLDNRVGAAGAVATLTIPGASRRSFATPNNAAELKSSDDAANH